MAEVFTQRGSELSSEVPSPNQARSAFGANLAAILTGQAATGVFALLTEICYTRILGPQARGAISLCLMSVAFGVLLGSAGGEGSIVYWTSKEKGSYARWLPGVFVWGALGSILACALWYLSFWSFHFPFLRGVSLPAAWLVLANIPAAIFFSYSMALLAGRESFFWRSSNAVARQVVALIVFVSVVLMAGRSVTAALWGSFIGCLAASLATLFLLRGELQGFWQASLALPNTIPTLAYGLRGQIGNLATFFTYRLDIFIISYFLPLSQLGYYALGVTISEVLWQIPSAVGSALFPRTARTAAEDATQFTCFLMRQVLLVTCVCGALIALLAPFFVPFVFGTAFHPSTAVVLFLLPGTMALCLAKVACSDLAGRGKNGYSSVFALVCLMLTVILDYALIPKMRIMGAALASTIAYSVDTVLVLIALQYELRVSWKKLLLPVREDFASYRASWSRFNANWITRNSSSNASLSPSLSTSNTEGD